MPKREHQIDDHDELILSNLEIDSRQTVGDLARKVGLSRTAVYERLNRLRANKVIEAFTIRRSTPKSCTIVPAYILVYLAGPICEQVAKHLEKIPQIKRAQSIGGEVDMVLFVEAVSLDELSMVREQIENIRGVRRVTTGVILKDRLNRP